MATRQTTLIREIVRIDPDYFKDRHNEIEYEFPLPTGKKKEFRADRDRRFPYDEEDIED